MHMKVKEDGQRKVSLYLSMLKFHHTLKPHRFAALTLQGESEHIVGRGFKSEKYYIHVYQAKIEHWPDDL